ncbi:hypothetical protein DFH09DRAFT_895420, partial [Mycena vulgaris]
MQTITGAVISGSLLPSILHNGSARFEVNDIDFYAPSRQAWRVVLYLSHSGGFTTGDIGYEYAHLQGVGRIWAMYRGTLKINVIESLSASARDSVVHHHSTPVIGTLCSDKAWLAYPTLSNKSQALATKYSLIADSKPTRRRAWDVVRKYTKRGF